MVTDVAIRTDANQRIGTGHFYRCLALADGLANAGLSVRFICNQLPNQLQSLIHERGHELRDFAASAAVHHDLEWAEDAYHTRRLLADHSSWEWLVVDNYALDARWEAALKPLVGGIMVIDDLANRPHACDVLLDQNAYPDAMERYTDLVNRGSRTLLGPRYALLRPEFRRARQSLVKPRSSLRTILVFFGGADRVNMTMRALQALQQAALPDLSIDVVVGGMNEHRAQIEAQCASMHNVSFHCQPTNILELMLRADLALGAAGTVSWERCCLKLPTVLVSIAENQLEVARGLAKMRAAVNLGTVQETSAERLCGVIRRLSERPALLGALSRRAGAIVDGYGVLRVSLALLHDAAISIRPATPDDAEVAWSWRNAESTRHHSFNSSSIPLESHLSWWQAALKSTDQILLMGTVASVPAGVLRLDVDGTVAKLSIYLDPQVTGQGIGPMLLQSSIDWLRAHLPQIQRVEALVQAENSASRRAFLKAGFEEHHTCFVRALNGQI